MGKIQMLEALTFWSSASLTSLLKRAVRERPRDGREMEGRLLRLPLLVLARRRRHITNEITHVTSSASDSVTLLPTRAL